jgi:hypothetical protein
MPGKVPVTTKGCGMRATSKRILRLRGAAVFNQQREDIGNFMRFRLFVTLGYGRPLFQNWCRH